MLEKLIPKCNKFKKISKFIKKQYTSCINKFYLEKMMDLVLQLYLFNVVTPPETPVESNLFRFQGKAWSCLHPKSFDLNLLVAQWYH